MKKRSFIDSTFPLGPTDIFIGGRVRAERLSLNMSATDFGAALGLTANQIYKIEAGKRHLYPNELIAMCDYLGLIPLAFFGELPSNEIPLPSGGTQNTKAQRLN